MHELSIAQSLAEMAGEAAQAAGATAVRSVQLRLGVLSGVVADALQFGWEIVTADTLLAGAQLVVVEAPVVIYCATCQANGVLASVQYLRCPTCGAPLTKIVQGRELELIALEIITNDDPLIDERLAASQRAPTSGTSDK